MSNIFFTADTHVSHYNIIKYTSRPFVSIEEMDKTLIENWNSTVKVNDRVYFLGDFAFSRGKRGKEKVDLVLSQLHGEKILIKGNHDSKETTQSQGWFRVCYGFLEEYVNNQLIVMCHYAMRTWNKSHLLDSYMLYGHEHNAFPEIKYNKAFGGLSLDVGVDSAAYYYGSGKLLAENYKPFSFDDIKKIMENKKNIIKSNNDPKSTICNL